jgi:pimeloyl-ACP methyl ester carboxylesterase
MICIVTAANAPRALARNWLLALVFAPMLALQACALLDAKQSQLALRPTPGRPAGLPDDAVLFRPGDQRRLVAVASADPATPDMLAVWWLPHPDPQAPTLLYLHGTFRNLYRNLPKIDALRDAGFAIVAVDYRGWGDSTPIVPSEQTIDTDVELAWSELVRHQPDAGRRVIFGHSMGGAAAVTLASRLRHGVDYGALVLESTFTRLPDVAAAAGFWGRVGATLTTLQFDSLAKIGRVDAPVLMLHGSADTTVPIELGRRLRDAAPAGVRWVEVPGGTHSQLHREAPELYRQTMHSLIHELSPAASAPSPAPSQ